MPPPKTARFAVTPPRSIRGMALRVSAPWRVNFCAVARSFLTVRFGNAFFSRNAETHAVIGTAENVTAWRQKFGGGARSVGGRKLFGMGIFYLNNLARQALVICVC